MTVCLDQISSALTPVAGAMLKPHWALAPIKDRLSVSDFMSEDPLHLTDTLITDQSDLGSFFLCFRCVCFYFALFLGVFLRALIVDLPKMFACVCEKWLVFLLYLLFNFLHPYQSITMYELKSSITMSPYSLLGCLCSAYVCELGVVWFW